MKSTIFLIFTVICGVLTNPVHPNYKTKLCEVYKSTGRCRLSEQCRYAHGKDELRKPSSSSSGSAFVAPNGDKLLEHERRIQSLEEDLEVIWQLLYRFKDVESPNLGST